MARRSDTLTAEMRPLPTTQQLLTTHYLPPMPDCDVARLDAAIAFASDQRAVRSDAVAVAEQACRACQGDIIAAAYLGQVDRLSAAVAAGVTAATELEVRRRELAVLHDAYSQLVQGRTIGHGDATYRGWVEDCRQIRNEWRETMQHVDQESMADVRSVTPEVKRAARQARLEYAMAGFAATH